MTRSLFILVMMMGIFWLIVDDLIGTKRLTKIVARIAGKADVLRTSDGALHVPINPDNPEAGHVIIDPDSGLEYPDIDSFPYVKPGVS